VKEILPEDPEIQFVPGVHVSPFELYRSLVEGHPMVLTDIRPEPCRKTLTDARTPAKGGEPARDADWVLFDDDGVAARDRATEMQSLGFLGCRALYGGLALYELAIDPQVVGPDTYLVEA
jgi:hypothetical protein